MSRDATKTSRGFTLFEVLVTVAVVAIVLPLAMRGISLATRLGSQSTQRAEAATLAKLRIDDLVASGNWRTGQLSGDFSPEYPNYRWSASTSAWSEGNLRQLDVEVTWEDNGRPLSIMMSTLVPQTAPAPQSTAGGS